MRHNSKLLLLLAMMITGCAPILVPVTNNGAVSTSIARVGPAGEDIPDIFVDMHPFQNALVDALNARDASQLKIWMTEPFLTGWWRGEMMDDLPADALDTMLNERLDGENKLAVVQNADLYTLMGDKSPLTLPRLEAGVESAFLVSGWGKDGRDEMVLFIARRPDNSLRWHGALLVPGGFTAQQSGGVQAYTNAAHGYRLFIPKGFEVQQPTATQVVIIAPGEGHNERGFISVEPANGRTAEEAANAVANAVKVETTSVMGIEGQQAVILDRLPGQAPNRQVFIVNDGVLYKMMFVPRDELAGNAYIQMEALYATVMNTFHFLPAHGDIRSLPITDLEQFEVQLRKALDSRDVKAVRALMSDSFTMAFWQSEGFNIAPSEAAQQIIVRFVPPDARMIFDNQKDYASLLGNHDPVVVAVPAVETVLPVYVSGWGLEGRDEAILYISKRMDGSLYWRGILTAQGGFPRPAPAPQPVGGIPVTGTQVQFVMANRVVNMRSGPATSYGVIGILAVGQKAKVTGASTDGNWWRVICPDNTVGNCWVSANPELTHPTAGN